MGFIRLDHRVFYVTSELTYINVCNIIQFFTTYVASANKLSYKIEKRKM